MIGLQIITLSVRAQRVHPPSITIQLPVTNADCTGRVEIPTDIENTPNEYERVSLYMIVAEKVLYSSPHHWQGRQIDWLPPQQIRVAPFSGGL